VAILANMLFEANEWVSHPDRILAIVGGAGVGGYGLGWCVQVAVRGWTRKQVPRWIVATLRVMGAVVSGWIVALWLFAGGGGGMGGPGGFGVGTGNNSGDETPAKTTKPKEETDHRPVDDLARELNMLTVEVLGSETLREIDKNYDPKRFYRLQTPTGPKLLTLQEVEEYVQRRAKEKPTLNGVLIVSYDNGPAENVARVADLTKDIKVIMNQDGKYLAVSYVRRPGNAPIN
jgi:hypothetical protein